MNYKKISYIDKCFKDFLICKMNRIDYFELKKALKNFENLEILLDLEDLGNYLYLWREYGKINILLEFLSEAIKNSRWDIIDIRATRSINFADLLTWIYKNFGEKRRIEDN